MYFQRLLLEVNQGFTFYFIFPLLVILGLFFTVKLRFLQFTKIGESLRFLLKSKQEGDGAVSNYQAVSAVIAGNLGTGNISGMAVALATGGPGALVWMWVMAFLGSVIQYSSCLLGAKYRVKNASGEFVGGPMYYLQNGLGFRKLAIIFSLCTIIAAVAVGNFAQVNSVVLPLKSLGCNPLLLGVFMAIGAALVMLGGMQRIAKAAASIVPIMAAVYLVSACSILYSYQAELQNALGVLFFSAFSFSSFAGGVMGFTVVKAISTGLERGVFATDAGTGIVPILQSGASTKNPVNSGILTLVAPFLVMIMCSMTGLVLIVTGAFEKVGLESTNMVVFAFQQFFGDFIGMAIVIVSLFLFAYTTVIAWGGCLARAAEFLWDKKKALYLQYLYLALIPVGAIMKVGFVWILADVSISFMLVINLIGIIGLSKEVLAESRGVFLKKDNA